MKIETVITEAPATRRDRIRVVIAWSIVVVAGFVCWAFILGAIW